MVKNTIGIVLVIIVLGVCAYYFYEDEVRKPAARSLRDKCRGYDSTYSRSESEDDFSKAVSCWEQYAKYDNYGWSDSSYKIETLKKEKKRNEENEMKEDVYYFKCESATENNTIVINLDEYSCVVNSREMEFTDSYPDVKCKYSTFTDSKWENVKKSARVDIHSINRETLRYKYSFKQVPSGWYSETGKCKFIKDKRLF